MKREAPTANEQVANERNQKNRIMAMFSTAYDPLVGQIHKP